jgi:uncharacterized membrane protein
MRIRDNENGQVLAITALAMTVLFGFLALAVDVGVLFRARRNMQIAADSAAFGAAMDYLYNGSKSSAQTAGKADATANGFTDGTKGAVVSINCPPPAGRTPEEAVATASSRPFSPSQTPPSSWGSSTRVR